MGWFLFFKWMYKRGFSSTNIYQNIHIRSSVGSSLVLRMCVSGFDSSKYNSQLLVGSPVSVFAVRVPTGRRLVHSNVASVIVSMWWGRVFRAWFHSGLQSSIHRHVNVVATGTRHDTKVHKIIGFLPGECANCIEALPLLFFLFFWSYLLS